MLTGRVDELVDGLIFGWAFNDEQPNEHLVIRVMRGPQVIASGVANIMRRDLPDAGIGDGDHAFRINVPPNITSFQGLMIIAQSQKSGEMPLPIATNDERRFDEMFTAFSARYEEVLVRFKDEMDGIKARCRALENAQQAVPTHSAELPADLEDRLNRLEARMEAAEVFFVRIDEAVRRLVEGKAGKRKRFLGLF
jgi:hypothetical protein